MYRNAQIASKMRIMPAMINTTAEKTNHPVRFKTVVFPFCDAALANRTYKTAV